VRVVVFVAGLFVRYFGNVLFMFMMLFDLEYVGSYLEKC
jgi:hypothetical protein